MIKSICGVIFFSMLLITISFANSTGNMEKNISQAKKFVKLLDDGDFKSAAENFDGSMTAALQPDKLQEMWKSMTKKFGDFVDIVGTRTEKKSGYDIVFVTCRFENNTFDMKVVFNSAGQIAGLFFVPTQSSAKYQRPDYCDSSKFTERDVTIGEGKWKLHGKLTVPKGDGKFPAVILVHGSGPVDMDETIGPNKPFLDLACGLASKGIAVLRYNKRTYEYKQQMAKISDDITVKTETTDDVLAAVKLLRGEKKIDKIFVLGHSLGGYLIPRIAKMDTDIDGFIVMAGGTRPLEDVILDQYNYIFFLDGELSDTEKTVLADMKRKVAMVKSKKLSLETPSDSLPYGVCAKYWLDLRGYNPPDMAKSIDKPMLILQGGRDYQSTMEDFANWKSALGNRDDVQFRYYPKLNHLFASGEGMATPSEYMQAKSMDEKVISDIVDWINSNR